MKTEDLAKLIYDRITNLRRGGYHWDEWDDKREIKDIANMIDDHARLQTGGGFQNSGECETDGLSGFRG
jgi:hypothetical protein